MPTLFFTTQPKVKQRTSLLIATVSLFFSSQVWSAKTEQNIDEGKTELTILEYLRGPDFKEGVLGHGSDVFGHEDGIFDENEFKGPKGAASELIKRGLKNLRTGNKEQGIKDLESAWETAPDQPSAGAALAYAYLYDRQYQKAMKVAEKLNENLPNQPHGLIIEGFAHQGLSNETQAKSAFLAAIKLRPGEPTATARLAEYALREKNIAQARDLYLDAIKHDPTHIRTLALLTRLDASLGNTDQAEKLILAAIQKSPNTATVHNNFAQIYEQLKKYPLAIREIEKALKIEPNNASSQFMHAKLLAYDGQLETAQDILKKLSAAYPDKPEPRLIAGRVALAQNKQDEAIKLFQEALTLRDSTAVALQLATAQILKGELDAGLATLRGRLEKSPSDIPLRAAYAELLRKHGKLDDARQHYEDLLHQQPDNTSIRNNFAWLLVQQGKLDEALLQAKQAHDTTPEEPNIMDTYGVILLKKGQHDKAEAILKMAAGKLPDNQTVNFHWSQALANINRKEQARELLKKLLSQKSTFDERQAAEQLLNSLTSP